jgi:hypothetical protein
MFDSQIIASVEEVFGRAVLLTEYGASFYAPAVVTATHQSNPQ